jgi:hypothetical protein
MRISEIRVRQKEDVRRGILDAVPALSPAGQSVTPIDVS